MFIPASDEICNRNNFKLKMRINTTIATILTQFLYVFAFDELIFYANGESSSIQEMRKAGQEQYQILRERGKLPKYGECWKSALEHVEESCRQLTEETQSDVALHITNCFLEMSGHDTYSCESDKKPNLRAICLQSMTDRAFNVYTEFFTHAQNICWFLRGTLWQETIEENTRKVGKQLDRSSKNQETLLRNQLQSLELQEKMLKYGEEMDAMMARFVATTKQHQDLIQMLTTSVSNLQTWLIGEVSWLDSAIFYLLASFVVVFVTSTPRALAARLPMLVMLGCNILCERVLCFWLSRGSVMDAGSVHSNYYTYVCYLRYAFVALMAVSLGYNVFMYKDYLVENHMILETIKESMKDLKHSLEPKVLLCNDDEHQDLRCLDNTPHLQDSKLRNKTRQRIIATNGIQSSYYYDQPFEVIEGSGSSRGSSKSRYNLRCKQI